MLYCSHCGTQNRDGSKFCNNCGARLAPESGLRCPMCSTPNPVESVFCVNCGARLVPLTAASIPESKAPAPPIKGLSLPAKPQIPSEPSEPSASSEEPAQIPALSTPAPLAPDELPDWIARLRSAQTAAEEEPADAEEETDASEVTPEDATSVPDWLSRLRVTPPADDVSTADAEPKAQIPDWVEKTPEQPATETVVSPAEQVDMPEWLKEPPSSAPSSADEEDLPDWLRAPVGKATTPQEKTAEPASAAEWKESVEESKPAEPLLEPLEKAEIGETAEPLLESLEKAEIGETVEPEPSVSPAAPQNEDDEIPDWLRLPQSAQSAAESTAPIDQPAPGQVPAWLIELKPTGISAVQPASGLATNEVELTGPLEGLRGVLPLAAAIAEPHHNMEEAPQPVSQTEGGQIFESVLAAPGQATAAGARPARFVLTMRPFIYLLLLLAVLVPFLLPVDQSQSTISIAGTPAAEFFDTLQQQVPANSTVLLSFDYDPSMSGEMDLQARAIVRDLVKRRVKIIAVSTLETGPQIARRILDASARETSDYAYGSSYVIVYLPGHEAGLAQFAVSGLPTATDFVDQQSIAPFLTAAKIKTLRDLPLIIEFAGSEEPLKTWVEQVQPRTDVRIVAAVSAGVEPKARAYRNSNQLTAMLSGLLGAAQYEALSSQPGLAVISLNAQTAAQFVLVFVVLLGNVVFWISRVRDDLK